MTTNRANIENILKYCGSLAVEFKSRLDRVRTFVPNNAMSGTANEDILRDFLSELVARDYEVSQGFIRNPLKASVSRQCDLLMFDRAKYPLVFSQGSVRIVWPEAVLLVAEIKTTMDRIDRLAEALANITSAKVLEEESINNFSGIIFAFQSMLPDTILHHLRTAPIPAHYRPLAVLLFDRDVVIHQINDDAKIIPTRYGGGAGAYEMRASKGTNEPGTFVLTYLFLLFLQIQAERSNAFNVTDIYSAMNTLIIDHTDLL